MTKNEINAEIETREAELANLRSDIVNGPQNDETSHLLIRRKELQTEIAEFKAMLDEL